MSRDELAEKLRISKQTLVNMENGQRGTTNENIIKLCDIFSVSADYLMRPSKVYSNIDEVNELLKNASPKLTKTATEMVRLLVRNCSDQ